MITRELRSSEAHKTHVLFLEKTTVIDKIAEWRNPLENRGLLDTDKGISKLS